MQSRAHTRTYPGGRYSGNKLCWLSSPSSWLKCCTYRGTAHHKSKPLIYQPDTTGTCRISEKSECSVSNPDSPHLGGKGRVLKLKSAPPIERSCWINQRHYFFPDESLQSLALLYADFVINLLHIWHAPHAPAPRQDVTTSLRASLTRKLDIYSQLWLIKPECKTTK